MTKMWIYLKVFPKIIDFKKTPGPLPGILKVPDLAI